MAGGAGRGVGGGGAVTRSLGRLLLALVVAGCATTLTHPDSLPGAQAQTEGASVDKSALIEDIKSRVARIGIAQTSPFPAGDVSFVADVSSLIAELAR